MTITSRLALAAVLAVAAVAQPPLQAHAQDSDIEKYTREVVRDFDFEERHGESTPINWTKATGRNLPAYTRGRLDRQVFHSTTTSFRFDMDGGNCIYEYDPHRIVINPAFDYAVCGWIRTSGLKHSRAYIAVWFNDDRGRFITSSKVRTTPIGGDTDWTYVEVFISPQADAEGKPHPSPPRFADIAMEVLGAEVHDIGAKVWFDDVCLYRIPRLAMSVTDHRVLFNQGEKVVVTFTADGLLAGGFPGQLRVTDGRGQVVYSQVAPLIPDDKGAGSQVLTLPDLPPGAYHLDYDIAGGGSAVLRRSAAIAVLAPRRSPDYLIGKGFGVADVSGIDDPDRLADILATLGVRSAKVAIWQTDSTPRQIELGDPSIERLIGKLRHRGVQFVGIFGGPPRCLVTDLKETIRGSIDFLALDPATWQRSLGFSMSRYAGIINVWQIGGDDDPSVVRLQVEPHILDAATRQMDGLTAAAPIGLPWPALYAVPARLPERVDFLSLRVGAEIMPDQIQEYLLSQSRERQPRVFLTLDPIAREGHDPDGRIYDLVSRVLAAKRAGVEEIFFHRLVDPEIGLLASPDEPTELFVVARTLDDMLGSSTFAGWLPLEHDAAAMVFERPDGSETVVIWKEDLKVPVKEPLYLGENLIQTDLFGNQTVLPRFGSVSSVTLQPMPVFITGIDPQISGTRRSFRLRGGAIDSAYRRHTATIEFTNRFKRGITGKVRLRGPAGWNLDPSTLTFNLADGEQFTRDITVSVPYNETIGPKEIIADFDVDAKITYRFVAVAPIRFEMATARTNAIAYVEGNTLVIEQEVTCTANRPTTYSAYVQIPGRPMISYTIPKMEPGESVVKRYTLPCSPAMEGKTALVGIRDDSPDRNFANVLIPLTGIPAERRAAETPSHSSRYMPSGL